MKTLSLPLRVRRRATLSAFNPSLPVDGSLVVAGELRGQFNGLAALIAAISSVNAAVVDEVSTLPPGDPATVEVGVTDSTLHFRFGIPQGAEGLQGAPGIPGPPFAQAVVDTVETLLPWESAWVTVSFDETDVHFSYGIPRGETGTQGEPGSEGATGAQGPPFAQAVVDGVNTLNPGEPATVDVSFDGTNVHFTFGIPRGYDGSEGPPGEVTYAELNAAISGTSSNSNGVSTLGQGAYSEYNQSQMQDVLNKLDELINALRR